MYTMNIVMKYLDRQWTGVCVACGNNASIGLLNLWLCSGEFSSFCGLIIYGDLGLYLHEKTIYKT